MRLTASFLHARHGGTPCSPARAKATRAEPRGSPPHASLSRAAPSLSSRPCFLPNGVELRRNSKCKYIYPGQLSRNCKVKPLRVSFLLFAFRPSSFSGALSLVLPAFSAQPFCFLNLCSGPWRYFPVLLKGASQSLQIFSGLVEGATWSLHAAGIGIRCAPAPGFLVCLISA